MESEHIAHVINQIYDKTSKVKLVKRKSCILLEMCKCSNLIPVNSGSNEYCDSYDVIT